MNIVIPAEGALTAAVDELSRSAVGRTWALTAPCGPSNLDLRERCHIFMLMGALSNQVRQELVWERRLFNRQAPLSVLVPNSGVLW
jgi:hypothetical protein